MKSALILIIFSLILNTQTSFANPIRITPIFRPIVIYPQFKNIRYLQLDRKLSLKDYLVYPQLGDESEIRNLNDQQKQLLGIFINDVRSNGENFNPINLSNLIYILGSSTNSFSIDDLCIYVLMQTTLENEIELRLLIAEVKNYNEKKESLRKHSESLFKIKRKCNEAPCTPQTLTKINNEIQKAKNELDSINELNEESQLRLQMYMDKLTKASSIASNILKKISETSSSIIGNIK
ncbi:MAG: hypothetical protein U0T83_03460 [Bacteriovoracaceae bacterium]